MAGVTTYYITEFDIAAIILTVMLLFMVFIRRTYHTTAIKLYTIMLGCNLISSVADYISAYTIANPGLVSVPENYVINIAFLLFHNLTSVVFMIYVISNIRRNTGNKGERILWITLISVLAAGILSSPWTKLVFYFDVTGTYTHGPIFFMLYLVSAVTIIYSAYLIIKHRKIMSSFQIGTNFAFILFVIASIIFQSFAPNVLIENFTIAIACLMMNIALDNPAIYFYKNTSCNNQSAFNASIEKKVDSGSEFILIAYNLDDTSIVRKMLSENEFEELILQLIKRGQKNIGHSNLFILQDGSFVVMQDKCNVEKLIRSLETALTPEIRLSTGKTITISIHFAVLNFPGEAKTSNDVALVIHHALSHIYKKTGEHIIWNSTKLLEDRRRNDEIVHFLRSVVKNDGIMVYFQPMLNIKTGKYNRAEALVRLKENPLNAYPDEFIPIAEENGLITDIGAAVMEHVCRFMKESGASEFGIERINVNLSMLQLVRRSEVDRLVDICRKYGISPGQIVLEVTETATQGDGSEAVYENIKYLKELGFLISLDDYGSGYSNMDNLVRLSFDQIKVDKTLLWSAVKDENSMTVLKNVIILVQNLGMECVVEGIEDDAMEDLLAKLDVDYLQGFKYSKPITDLALIKFMKDHNGQ